MGRGVPLPIPHPHILSAPSAPVSLRLRGLPLSTIAPLQRVQNAAARLVLGLSWSDHVRPALKELHWLPVVYRIKFKLVLVMFTIHTHQCPDYLTDSVHPYSNNDPARYRLRSATGTN